jgi:rubrerythrin
MDYEERIKYLKKQIEIKESEILNIIAELDTIYEKKFEEDTNYVKIVCINCEGCGYINIEDNKKEICNMCNNNKYIWLKKYTD